MEDRLSRTWLDELLVSGGGGGAGEVASFVLSFGDFVRVLPRLLAASPGADLGWHGPAVGDDRFGLGRGERVAVGVADDVRGAAPHDGPGPFGEAGGGYAQGAEVVFAAFGHTHQAPVIHPASLTFACRITPARPRGGTIRPRSQAAEASRGSHSCAVTGPGLGGPAHFPHPGHPWPGQE